MNPAMNVPVRFGILGLHEGRTLLRALGVTEAGSVESHPLRRVPEAVVTMACDLRPEVLAACRAEHPGVRFTTEADQLFESPEVDVVAIYTPDALHAQHIVQAMQAGKHVLVTKPLVTSVEDARAVLAAARLSGRRLMVGQSTRFFEPFMRQRSAFERGELGTLELLDTHYIHRMDWYYRKSPWVARDTDWAFLGLSHPVDLAIWYVGGVRSVQAQGRRSALASRHGCVGFDIYCAQLVGEGGQLVRVMGHFGLHELPRARNAIELLLYGSKGSSLAQYHDMRYLHTAEDGSEIVEDSLYAKRAYYFNNEVHGMHYGEFAITRGISPALCSATNPTSPT